jgi:hypothetical protein
MHATESQGGACPDTRTDTTADRLVALLGDPEAFRLNIAQQMTAAAAAQQPAPVAGPPSGPDLKAMSQQEFYHWARGDKPATTDGYLVTDAGIRAPTGTIGQSEAPGTAASVLRSAALYLERYGWVQGAYYDQTATCFTPAACMVGAIAMVCYGGPVEAPAQHFDDPGYLDFEEAVLHLDRWLLVNDGAEAYEFNDATGRTVGDVIDALWQAAATPAGELVAALRLLNSRAPHRASQVGGDAE